MNKLEEIHIIAFDALNPMKMAEKSAEITTNVAIKFLTFVEDNYYFSSGWYSRKTDKFTKHSDLFKEFINNHYGK